MKQTTDHIKVGVEAFIATWSFIRITGMETTNVITVFAFAMLYYIFSRIRERKRLAIESVVQKRVEYALSGIFTILYLCGGFEQIYGGLNSRLFQCMVLVVTAMGLFISFEKAISIIIINTVDWKASKNPLQGKGIAVIVAIVCFICWIPYLLKNFPGVMTIDSMNQFAQVIGIYAPSNHHPWMHTLVMRLFYNIGMFVTGDRTSAIAFYTVFQMIFMAACIGYLVRTLLRIGLNKWALILITAFYALVPYNALYAVTVWKDSMFAGGVLLYVSTLLRLLSWTLAEKENTEVKEKQRIDQRKVQKDNQSISLDELQKNIQKTKEKQEVNRMQLNVERITDLIMLVISGLLMSLFRTNGWYAFLVTVPFVVIVCKRYWKQILGLQLLVVVLVLLIKGPFMNAQHVIQPDLVESLSIPVQQISRVIVQNRPLTQKQDEFLNRILDTSKIEELYNPYVSDGFKRLVRAGDETYLEEHFGEFLKVYMQIGLKYPGDYMLAFRDQSIGYWFPTQSGIIAGDEGVIPNEFGVENRPVLKGPLVIKINEIALKLKDMLPGYGILWSMGALFWIILVAMGIIVVRGDRRQLLLYVPAIAIMLTLIIATPVAKEFRYAYAYIFCLPLFLTLPFMKN